MQRRYNVFYAILPISLAGSFLEVSGFFQNFSQIKDTTARAIPIDKTINAVKILSKAIFLKALSSHTISEYLR